MSTVTERYTVENVGSEQSNMTRVIKMSKPPTGDKFEEHEKKKSGTVGQRFDQDGNCRASSLIEIPAGSKLTNYPFERNYIVESKHNDGTIWQTCGFALRADRVITADIHTAPSMISVRAFRETDTGAGDQFVAAHAATAITWRDADKIANQGMNYCVLGMEPGLIAKDKEFDMNFTTIGAATIGSFFPQLTMITRRVPFMEVLQGTTTGRPRKVTTAGLANWYSSDFGGYRGKIQGNTIMDYLRGSPVYVREVDIDPITQQVTRDELVLVGLATDTIVDDDPCSVNIGLFEDRGAVDILVNGL